MAEFRVRIDCDNEAFGEWKVQEVARILRKIANDIEYDDTGYCRHCITIRDLNGNDVGRYKLVDND